MTIKEKVDSAIYNNLKFKSHDTNSLFAKARLMEANGYEPQEILAKIFKDWDEIVKQEKENYKWWDVVEDFVRNDDFYGFLEYVRQNREQLLEKSAGRKLSKPFTLSDFEIDMYKNMFDKFRKNLE